MANESAHPGSARDVVGGSTPGATARTAEAVPEHPSVPLPVGSGEDEPGWSWPPYAPLEPADVPRFDCEEWAPSSIVRRPLVRLGRWTLLYRRA